MLNPHRELAKLDLSWVVRPDACAARKAAEMARRVKDDTLNYLL